MAIEIWRLYKSSRGEQPALGRLSLEQLLLENEDAPEFVDQVVTGLINDGWYDDSDYNEGVICWYLSGEEAKAWPTNTS